MKKKREEETHSSSFLQGERKVELSSQRLIAGGPTVVVIALTTADGKEQRLTRVKRGKHLHPGIGRTDTERNHAFVQQSSTMEENQFAA